MASGKILFFAANPTETVRLELDKESRDIEQKIRASEHRDFFSLKTRCAVTADDLLQALLEDNPGVVHFSGHGEAAGIVLHGEGGGRHLVKADVLRQLFEAVGGKVKVVVLNACYGEEQARAIAKVVDCVVGMKAAISDEAARTFAASFYRGLGFGRSVQDAFNQGLVAISFLGLGEESVPLLLVKEGLNAKEVTLAPNPPVSHSPGPGAGPRSAYEGTDTVTQTGDPCEEAFAKQQAGANALASQFLDERAVPFPEGHHGRPVTGGGSGPKVEPPRAGGSPLPTRSEEVSVRAPLARKSVASATPTFGPAGSPFLSAVVVMAVALVAAYSLVLGWDSGRLLSRSLSPAPSPPSASLEPQASRVPEQDAGVRARGPDAAPPTALPRGNSDYEQFFRDLETAYGLKEEQKILPRGGRVKLFGGKMSPVTVELNEGESRATVTVDNESSRLTVASLPHLHPCTRKSWREIQYTVMISKIDNDFRVTAWVDEEYLKTRWEDQFKDEPNGEKP